MVTVHKKPKIWKHPYQHYLVTPLVLIHCKLVSHLWLLRKKSQQEEMLNYCWHNTFHRLWLLNTEIIMSPDMHDEMLYIKFIQVKIAIGSFVTRFLNCYIPAATITKDTLWLKTGHLKMVFYYKWLLRLTLAILMSLLNSHILSS